MQNPNIQLMLYGEDIGDLVVESTAEGLEVVKIHRTDNNNYLFVDLQIKNNREAAAYPIHLKKDKNTITKFDYQLLDRSPNSANRKGNSTADAIYLITPDRFANGNPNNDVVEGLQEGLDRSLEYGRHGGDLAGISDHLEYIKEVGFTAIWLNPVLENDQDEWSYHGYATTDYYKVDARLGTNEWSYHGYATTDYYKVDARLGTNEEYVALVKKA